MRKRLFSLLSLAFLTGSSYAQVVVTSTGGTPIAAYGTLGTAFNAINAGTHTGAINVQIAASTTEAGPCVLNSSDAAPASYTSILIQPSADGVSISGPTVAGRGLIELNGADNVTIDGDNPGTGGTNQNLTITNTAAAATQFTSAIRLIAGTGVPSANGNTIRNCVINGSSVGINVAGNTTGASNNTFGIFGGGGASGATLAPAALATVNTTNTAGTTLNGLLINNNTINNCARGVSINGVDVTAINTLSVTNNTIGSNTALIGNPPFTTPTSTIYTVGITAKGVAALTITGNTIQDVVSYATQPLRGIEIVGAVNTATVSGNNINGVVANNASGNNAEGIFVGSVTGPCLIQANTITNVQCMSSATPSGINIQNNATVDKNNVSKVYNRNTGTWGAFGINITAASTVLITNNFVYDINYDVTGGSAFNSTLGVAGIRLGAGTGHMVYNNTVSLFGSLLGTLTTSTIGTGCLQVYATSITGCDIRNNIFSNTMTGGSSVEHVCILLPTGPSIAMSLTLNNNAYFTGTNTANQGIGYVGTSTGTAANLYLVSNFNMNTITPATNWRALVAPLSAAGTNDNSSVASTAAAPFTSATNLHIPVGTATPMESGGASVGVTTDIDGQSRPGPAGSINGGGTAPDMGADEFDGVPIDIFPPTIVYTALVSTCSTGDRTLTATISDANSVNAGAFKPRIYYKKNSGTWFSQPGSLTAGTSISGTWQFTIFNSDMGGVAVGDVVSYYVIAQDIATPTANIAAVPGAGLVATNVNTVTTPPTTPNTYAIQNTLAGGTYTVGGGGTYPTLTAAVASYNGSCLSGPITFVLTNSAYTGPGETFPITINANGFASAVNTLTIQPAAGNAATITSGAASTAVIKVLNGAYVTINGLNTGGSSLTLNNSNTGTSAGIWLASTSAVGPGCNNVNIRNLTINGGGSTVVADWAILAAVDGATPSTTAGFNNDNITIQGNTFQNCGYGLYANGTAAISAGGLDNWNISNNNFGPAVSGANNIGVNGMFLQNMVNPTIAGNTIRNIGSNTATVQTVGITLASNVSGALIQNNTVNNVVSNATTSGTSSVSGISLGTSVINSTISRNSITGIVSTATGGYGSRAMIINTATNTSNLTIVNNLIADVYNYGDASNLYWAIGIDIDGTSGGINIYNNSINLFGSHAGFTTTGGAQACIFVNTTGNTLNIRNNVLSNSYDNTTSSGDKSYAIYSVAANTAYSAIDYNDYAVSGVTGVLAFLGSDLATLPALVAAYGGNTHSVNVVPTYVAANNTRLQAVNANALLIGATPIAGVTTDIDGVTRDPLHPTMGINEIVADPIFSGAGILCKGGNTANVSYTGASNVSTYSIVWGPAAAGAGFANVTNSPITPGAITVAVPTTASVATYTGTVTVSNGTMTSTGTVISIQVNPAPSLSSASNSGPICTGGTFNLYANTPANITSYAWSGPATITGTTLPFAFVSAATTSASGIYSVTVNNGVGSGCAVIYTTSVTVNALPNVTSFSVSATAPCKNAASTVTLRSTTLGSGAFTVSYYITGTNVLLGNTATLTMSAGSGSFITPALNNTGSTTVVITSITSGATTCTNTVSTGNTATFNVNALPASYPFTGGGDYCAGGTGVHIGLLASEPGVNYVLYIGSTAVSGVVNGTGGGIDFGAYTAAVSYTAIGTNTATSCMSNMTGSATVVIDPLPTAYTVTGGGNYCSGGTGVVVGISNSQLGVDYVLYNGSTALGIPVHGTGAAFNFGAQTLAGSYSVLAINATTSCLNNMSGSASIVINPLPIAYTVTGGGSYCAGGAGFHVGLSGTSAGMRYQLMNGTSTVGGLVDGTGTTLDFGAQTAAGTYTVMGMDTMTLCTNAMSGSATIVVNPLPAVHNVIGGGSFCAGGAGQEVKIDGSDLGMRYQLYNGIVPMGGMMDGTGDTVNFGLQTAGGAYTVVATDTTTMCTNNMAGSSSVVVNPLPPAHTVTGGGNYCAGSTGVHIGLNSSDAGIRYQLYNYALAVGAPMDGTAGTAIDFGLQTDTGMYSVVAMDTTTGCSKDMAPVLSVYINPLPVVYTVTGGGNSCITGSGVHVGLSGSVVGINYRLYFGTTAVGSVMPGTGSAVDFGLFTAGGSYTAVATDATTGCTSDMASSAVITVIAAPVVYNVFGGGQYCFGGTGQEVGLDGSTLGVNYQLYHGGTPLGTAMSGTGDTLNFGFQTLAGSYTVVANDPSTTCDNNMSSSAFITINPLLVPSVTIAATPGLTVCEGTSVTFSTTAINGGTRPVYEWSVNGAAVTNTGSSYSYTPINTDVIAVKLRSTATCATPDTTMDTVRMNVITNQLPFVSITAHPGNNVCQGTSVTFTDSTAFTGTAPSYSWVVNGSVVGTGATYTYPSPVNGAVVSRVLNSNYVCRLATTVYSNDIVMAVAAPVAPVVSIVETPGPMVAKTKSDTLTAVVINGGTAPLYQWIVNGGIVPGATSNTFIRNNFSNHDSVTVRVTRNDACGLTTFNSVLIQVGNVGVLPVTISGMDVKVMPNPNKGEFIVKGTLNTTADQDVAFEITDMLGQVVYKNKVTARNGELNEKINLGNNIANGMYMLSVHSESGNNVFHIVVEQ